MPVVILAGGRGTRLQEETTARPKPMVEIGGRPILWHIMKHYAHFGEDEFLIACGYMGDFIKGYFLDQYSLSGNLKIDFSRDDGTAAGDEFRKLVGQSRGYRARDQHRGAIAAA